MSHTASRMEPDDALAQPEMARLSALNALMAAEAAAAANRAVVRVFIGGDEYINVHPMFDLAHPELASTFEYTISASLARELIAKHKETLA